MNQHVTRRLFAVATVAATCLAPVVARAWWNEDWAGRKRIRIDTSATGAPVNEPIGTIPVLFRLHAGNFRFDAAKEDGSDLRFVAADDKTPLKFHLEKYDALLGEALAWVSIPDLKPGGAVDVWVYFKNPKAVAAEDAKGTYDPATSLVYHFGDRGVPPRDSTSWGNHATTSGTPADGALIGRGLKLDGTAPVHIPAGPSLAWAAGGRMTWSAWIRPAAAEATGVVFTRRDGGSAFVVGVEAGKPYVELSGPGGTQRATAPTAMAANGWHQVAVTAGDGVVFYVDGAAVGAIVTPLPALDAPSLLGGSETPAPSAAVKGSAVKGAATKGAPPLASAAGFQGEIDELQIAKVDRPSGFIRVSAISQGTDPGKLIVSGQDEETGGGGSGYIGILMRSVTLDGWIVIGVLAIMSVASWIVMVGKSGYLREVEKGNEQFAKWFAGLEPDLEGMTAVVDPSEVQEEKQLQRAPLYRIYAIGAQEVRKRTRTGKQLSAEAIEAVRASLDASMIRENQRLMKRIVLLTIAISGGPFLGLLGTVIGVMITFAAIAAAGDVNVNAIAPGIAAALVATVAGLAVAIPALFGYNWLLSRIKEVTATMQVFVDEFITKLAEAAVTSHAHNGPRQLASGE